MQHNGNHTAEKYFYLHDRLGSVRQIIDQDGLVVNYYTFDAFGNIREYSGTLSNPFMFTGQFYDSEIGQYYLRARQYDPALFRFTSRDPVFGQFEEPMTLHKYLYCGNEPVNRNDPAGLWLEKIHRTFGNYGWGYDSKRGMAPFDYALLDFTKSALDKRYRPLHFKSRNEVFSELINASVTDNKNKFEERMHEWQDSYVHYDRGFRAKWGHLKEGYGPDKRDDPINIKNHAYERCDLTTLVWEEIWFKSNPDLDNLDSLLNTQTTPWLSFSPKSYEWMIDF